MTTTTTTERVPSGALFDIEMKSPWTRLNGDPLWHALATGIDGYADLQNRLALLRAWGGDTGRTSVENAIEEATAHAASTGDVDAAWAPVRELMFARDHAGTAHQIHNSAIRRVQAEAERWVRSEATQDAFARAMTAHISTIVDEARELALVVAGARSYDEIGADAPRATAFAQTMVLAEQLRLALATAGAVVLPIQPVGTGWAQRSDRWPWVFAFPALDRAWPQFWRLDPLTVSVRGSEPDRYLPAARPWFDPEYATSLDVIAGIVERGLRIEIGSSKRCAARSEVLDAAAGKRRAAESEQPTDPDWTTTGGAEWAV